MAVHRAEVAEAQALEKIALLEQCGLHGVLHLLRHTLRVRPELADLTEQFPHLVLHLVVALAGGDVGEVFLERAHVRVDAHAVVVQHHEQVAVGGTAVVERLEGHAGGHRAVADHGHGVAVQFALQLAGHGHAERAADGGAAVAHAEGVVLTFAALGETAEALVQPVGVEQFTPSGEDLVPVGLVSHVPNELVVGRVEDVVQCHGELHHAKAGAEVAALHAHHVDDEVAELLAHLIELRFGDRAQVRGNDDAIEQGVGAGGLAHGRKIQKSNKVRIYGRAVG